MLRLDLFLFAGLQLLSQRAVHSAIWVHRVFLVCILEFGGSCPAKVCKCGTFSLFSACVVVLDEKLCTLQRRFFRARSAIFGKTLFAYIFFKINYLKVHFLASAGNLGIASAGERPQIISVAFLVYQDHWARVDLVFLPFLDYWIIWLDLYRTRCGRSEAS